MKPLVDDFFDHHPRQVQLSTPSSFPSSSNSHQPLGQAGYTLPPQLAQRIAHCALLLVGNHTASTQLQVSRGRQASHITSNKQPCPNHPSRRSWERDRQEATSVDSAMQEEVSLTMPRSCPFALAKAGHPTVQVAGWMLMTLATWEDLSMAEAGTDTRACLLLNPPDDHTLRRM